MSDELGSLMKASVVTYFMVSSQNFLVKLMNTTIFGVTGLAAKNS
jgi:hypothetical protein